MSAAKYVSASSGPELRVNLSLGGYRVSDKLSLVGNTRSPLGMDNTCSPLEGSGEHPFSTGWVVENSRSPLGVESACSPQGVVNACSPLGVRSTCSLQGVGHACSPLGVEDTCSPQGVENTCSPQSVENARSPLGVENTCYLRGVKNTSSPRLFSTGCGEQLFSTGWAKLPLQIGGPTAKHGETTAKGRGSYR